MLSSSLPNATRFFHHAHTTVLKRHLHQLSPHSDLSLTPILLELNPVWLERLPLTSPVTSTGLTQWQFSGLIVPVSQKQMTLMAAPSLWLSFQLQFPLALWSVCSLGLSLRLLLLSSFMPSPQHSLKIPAGSPGFSLLPQSPMTKATVSTLRSLPWGPNSVYGWDLTVLSPSLPVPTPASHLAFLLSASDTITCPVAQVTTPSNCWLLSFLSLYI